MNENGDEENVVISTPTSKEGMFHSPETNVLVSISSTLNV